LAVFLDVPESIAHTVDPMKEKFDFARLPLALIASFFIANLALAATGFLTMPPSSRFQW